MFLLEGYVYWPDMVLVGLGIYSAAALTLAVIYLKRKAGLPPPSKNNLYLTFSFDSIKIKGIIMAVTLSTIEEVTGQVTPKNKKGGPAKVEAGSVSYSSSDESIATVEEDPNDETKFKIVAKGEGVAQVDIKADADLGAGVVEVAGFVAVEVLPAGATGFGVTLGTPTEQP